ncbi:MAG: GTP cyclohydrolase I FolE2 [Candidatus Zixiibacteriota bacterium]|nr:MAG: GTP cyclohydrolase I FolE2 [candidate division Zixibacteria bacterium]
MTSRELPDVQSQTTGFPPVYIEEVGVRGVKVSLLVLRPQGAPFETVAEADLLCDLNPHTRGINMSRLPEVLIPVAQQRDATVVEKVFTLLKMIRERLDSEHAFVRFKFPYLVSKTSPVSEIESPLPVDVAFIGKGVRGEEQLWMSVSVPYLSLCPCSLELTGGRGAHNQRSVAEVNVELNDRTIWIEEVVELVERKASAPLFSILKRPDEKWVTEHAHENPRFVEDMSRALAEELVGWVEDGKIRDFVVTCEHFESIHPHSAFSRISYYSLRRKRW